MKLALVFPDLGHKGGAESVVVWSAVGLARRGHEVRVFTAGVEPSLWPEFPELAGLVEIVRPVTRGSRLKRNLATGRNLADRLSLYPLVFAHNRYGLLWSLACESRLLWYVHEPSRRLHARHTDAYLLQALERHDVPGDHPAFQQLQDWLHKQEATPWARMRAANKAKDDRRWAKEANRVLTNSRYNAEVIQASLGVSAEVLYPGAPPPALVASDQERSGIAVLSSSSPKKNLFTVLQAAAVLEREKAPPEWRFTVWGVGTDGPDFQEMVQSQGLQDRVRLLGFVPDQESWQLLASARLALFLPLCEPFGLVAAEALMLQTPILASDHGGPVEILQACDGGRAVDPLRPDLIAHAIGDMLSREELWRGQAEKASVEARNRYSLDAFLDALEPQLAATLENSR